MKEVIAMHGWCGDSHMWKEWENLFQTKQWHWQSGERGYGELTRFDPHWKKYFEKSSTDRRVLISHSLGFHLLDHSVIAQATDLILLASFSRFITLGKRTRSLKAALNGMKKLIGTSQEASMLKAFFEKAAYPASSQDMHQPTISNGLSLEGRETLKSDLDLLINTQGLPGGLSSRIRVLVVEGQEDAIVIPESRKALIDDLDRHLAAKPIHWSLPKTGHALAMPGLIELILNWLESCA